MSPMVRTFLYSAVTLLLAGPAAAAQDEAALKAFFEGKRVTVKMDMPATSAGVDVHPALERPIDFKKYGDRIKAAGVSLREGDAAIVTLIKVKKDLIEFQLGGGGYDSGSGYVAPDYIAKSNLEKQLEDDVKAEKDAARKRQLQRQLDDERNRRQREQRRANDVARMQEAANKTRIAEERLRAGSRFNLRFEPAVPAAMATPEAIMRVLAPYIDFSGGEPAGVEPAAPGADQPAGTLRKGMRRADAERVLGPPESSSDRNEGTLTVTTLVFVRGEQRISAEFIEDVLIRYTISSR
jgi:hypothetical protein